MTAVRMRLSESYDIEGDITIRISMWIPNDGLRPFEGWPAVMDEVMQTVMSLIVAKREWAEMERIDHDR